MDFDSEVLFQFNKTHGSTPHNFIPDGPVREHLRKLATGKTVVWGAFAGEELAGFITCEVGGGYWLQGKGSDGNNSGSSFINEFVVSPNWRGKQIGQNLTSISVDPKLGMWGAHSQVEEVYTTGK